MKQNILAALFAFLGGAVIALINGIITAKKASSKDASLSPVFLVRQLLGAVYLAAVFFIFRHRNCEIAYPLLGAAVGLTVPSILFSLTIARNMKGDDK